MSTMRDVCLVVLLANLALLGVIMFIPPMLRGTIPYSPTPNIPVVTYTVEIHTLSGARHIRYNVVSYHIDKGIVPATHTVTLNYVGGSSETFHWVISYKILRN